MRVTNHGEQRIVERVGGKRKSAGKIAEKAFQYGLKHSETSGRLHKYITKLHFLHPDNNTNIRIYHRRVYIFGEDVLITVFQLPHNLCEIADIQQKKKQGQIIEPKKGQHNI